MTTPHKTVEAAGRVLSTKNANSLKKAFVDIANILIGAGVLTENVLQDLANKAEGTDEDSSGSEEGDAEAVAAAAEGFKTQVQRVTWHDRLRSVTKIFYRRFLDLHNLTEPELQRQYGLNEDERAEYVVSLIEDFRALLSELSKDHPGPTDDLSARWEGIEAPYMHLSAEANEPEPVNVVKLSFECPVQAASGRRKPKGNRKPVSGVLFRIGEPSEAAPSKGPKLPLYIPQEVAAAVVNRVSGLPLDAHDNLDRHADQDIVGVMMSAEIKDNDFIVHGLLWPSSQEKKAEAIAANRDKLGMSMTADAWGHEAEIEGRKVFWVDALDLKGANILYSDHATYQQTRLIAAEKLEPPASDSRDPTPVAAATDDADDSWDDFLEDPAPDPEPQPTQSSKQEDIMTDEQLKQFQTQLNAIGASIGEATALKSTVEQLAASMQTLAQSVQTVQASVQTIEQERQAQQAAIAAARSQEQEEARQKALTEMITKTVQETIKATVNPSGQPPRRTVALAAGAGATTAMPSEVMQIQLQLARLDGQITALRNQPAGSWDGAKEMELLDQKRLLEASLTQ